MSLDGGYIGSLDHAIANLHLGRRQGHQQGVEEGYQQGHADGYRAGWDAGVEAGNVQILKAMDYIRQHVADKEALQAELQRLREQMAALEGRASQYTVLLRQYNCIAVVLHAVRRVLEHLISDPSPLAMRVRALFAQEYAREVHESLEEGTIQAAPDGDHQFAKESPRTRQFLADILQAAGKQTQQ